MVGDIMTPPQYPYFIPWKQYATLHGKDLASVIKDGEIRKLSCVIWMDPRNKEWNGGYQGLGESYD